MTLIEISWWKLQRQWTDVNICWPGNMRWKHWNACHQLW